MDNKRKICFYGDLLLLGLFLMKVCLEKFWNVKFFYRSGFFLRVNFLRCYYGLLIVGFRRVGRCFFYSCTVIDCFE